MSKHTVTRRWAEGMIEGLEARTMLSAAPVAATLQASAHQHHVRHLAHLRAVARAVARTTVTPRLVEGPPAGDATANNATGPAGFAPADVRHVYGFDKVTGDGTGQTIAIVDAYDDPNVLSDLDAFDNAGAMNAGRYGTGGKTLSQYGAASSFLTKVKMAGNRQKADAGWSQEIALDVEWAHAIAPGAKILLVEASSSGLGDLLKAVDYARKQTGVSVVSMSWGAGEFSGEASYDSYFTTPSKHTPVSFVASSGDTGGAIEWPAASPNVLGVGGTTLSVNTDNTWASESVWGVASAGQWGSGGGTSAYESQPAYQAPLITGTMRTSPDVAYDADPSSGFSVYESYGNSGSPWMQFGGTSAGSPQWAALLAITNQMRGSKGNLNGTTQVLPTIYKVAAKQFASGGSPQYFHDVTAGTAGGNAAQAGYDLATGVGSPLADQVIGVLAGA